jgi:hypothetical protein
MHAVRLLRRSAPNPVEGGAVYDEEMMYREFVASEIADLLPSSNVFVRNEPDEEEDEDENQDHDKDDDEGDENSDGYSE